MELCEKRKRQICHRQVLTLAFLLFQPTFFLLFFPLQVCKWASESLGQCAKQAAKASTSGKGNFHSYALWVAVSRCLEIDENAVENVTISLLQALTQLATDWKLGQVDGDKERISKAIETLLLLINRSAAQQHEAFGGQLNRSATSSGFFLSGGVKVALGLLKEAIQCYKKCRDDAFWERICIQILRETRPDCKTEEVGSFLLMHEHLYFDILFLLESEKAIEAIKNKAEGKDVAEEDHATSRSLTLINEALCWIQDFYFPAGDLLHYEDWLLGIWGIVSWKFPQKGFGHFSSICSPSASRRRKQRKR